MARRLPQNRPASRPANRPQEDDDARAASVRIIGGQFRGRKLEFGVDPRTRPMKDRVREALFNLIGPDVVGSHAVDLFAGTGALGLEAVSRGARGVTFIERHYPTAELIGRNIALLSAGEQCEVLASDTFAWLKRGAPLPPGPWLVLCSPPFEFFETRWEEMLGLISHFVAQAPPRSIVAVEAPLTFDGARLPDPRRWDVRPYPPAQLAILRL